MSFSPQRPGKSSSPPLVQPFLYALNRMQERESFRPEQIETRVRELLDERFGPSDQPGRAWFTPGCVGLMSEHTHFFDGFALMMPLPPGTAVAVRPASGAVSRIAFEEPGQTHILDAAGSYGGSAGMPTDLVQALLQTVLPEGSYVEVAVISTVAEQHADAYATALGVSLLRAVESTFGGQLPERVSPGIVADAIARCMGRPFSIAYPLAVWEGRADTLMLVDTGTGEWLPLEAPPQEAVGWGLVDACCTALQEPGFYVRRLELAQEALGHLRQNGFGEITSFRGLEHRDLLRAVDVLPPPLRPIVRYLVSENRRVQKLVAALRRKDWQMLGALLLISHASKRNDLEAACPEADLAVDEVEQMLIDGMYGATLTGSGGFVVVAGQPYVVPNSLDRIQAALQSRFGTTPEVVLL